jgi:hypothetical protein
MILSLPCTVAVAWIRHLPFWNELQFDVVQLFPGHTSNLSTSGRYHSKHRIRHWLICQIELWFNVCSGINMLPSEPPHAWQSDQMIFLSSVIAFTTISSATFPSLDTLNLDIFFWWFRDWEWCVMIDIISKYIKDRPIFQFWQCTDENAVVFRFIHTIGSAIEWISGTIPIPCSVWPNLSQIESAFESFENAK